MCLCVYKVGGVLGALSIGAICMGLMHGAHRSASRSNTIRLLKPCLSSLYMLYNGRLLPLRICSRSLFQVLNIGFTGEAALFANQMLAKMNKSRIIFQQTFSF